MFEKPREEDNNSTSESFNNESEKNENGETELRGTPHDSDDSTSKISTPAVMGSNPNR